MKIMVLLVLLMLTGVSLAQADQPLPADWGSLITLLIAGIPALVAALRKPINWQELIRSRTFWTGVSGFLTAVGLFVAGSIGLPALIGALYLALVAIFIRDAVSGSGGGGAGAPKSTGGNSNISSLDDWDRIR